MKPHLCLLTAVVMAWPVANASAEDSPGGCKCEMMKKPARTPAAEVVNSEAAELEKLLAEMNGNAGPKKLEAMAALVNRLVEQARTKAAVPMPQTPADTGVSKGETHQH